MATTVTRYVNTDSTAGGDGTTNATSGANRAYATLGAAVAEVDGRDLVGNDEQWNIYCSAPSGVKDTSNVNFSHPVNDATRYLAIYGEDHGGKLNTAKYISESREFQIIGSGQEKYCRIISLQRVTTGSGSQDANAAFRLIGGGIYIDRCIIKNISTGSGTGGICAGFWGDSGISEARISNCIIYDFNLADGYRNTAGLGGSYWNPKISNCTIINCRRGVSANHDGTTNFLRNTIIQCDSEDGSYTDIVGPWHATNSKNNLTSDATNVGTSQVSSTTLTFVDKANDDFHLAASDSAAIDAGADLSADSYMLSVNDIDNVARSGTWDIGADEYVAVAASKSSNHGRLLLGIG